MNDVSFMADLAFTQVRSGRHPEEQQGMTLHNIQWLSAQPHATNKKLTRWSGMVSLTVGKLCRKSIHLLGFMYRMAMRQSI